MKQNEMSHEELKREYNNLRLAVWQAGEVINTYAKNEFQNLAPIAYRYWEIERDALLEREKKILAGVESKLTPEEISILRKKYIW